MSTTVIFEGNNPSNPDNPSPVTLYRNDDSGDYSLVVGTNGHAPRWCDRMSRAQVRRLAYAILAETEE